MTTLSPWIRHRLLLEEEVVAAAISTHGFSRSEKFIQEVFWRTYWKGWLEIRPQVWWDYISERDSVWNTWNTWQNNDSYLRAILGDTGIDCFDFWVNELKQSNYLHNHARM
jgi:deoxyribodipyrimidine photo-lyase